MVEGNKTHGGMALVGDRAELDGLALAFGL